MVHVRQRLVAAMVNPSRLSLSFSRYALVGMWRMSSWLLGRLPEGPLDIVGDIHGEIGALAQLLTHLGYGPEGTARTDRRLVFVGDLVDRGPDSPGVVRLVRRLIEADKAVAVLGNHELNLLLNRRREGNEWFFGERSRAQGSPPAVCADPATQRECYHFFANLPLCLERNDLRVVHASWQDEAVASLGGATSAISLFEDFRQRIETQIHDRRKNREQDPPQEAVLCHQNLNPVKVLLSGPEERSVQPYWASGRFRHLRRSAWWETYQGPLCVFGHYWRLGTPGKMSHIEESRLFENFAVHQGYARTFCVDYSVGARWRERLLGPNEPFVTRLGAIRWPESQLAFDNGEIMQLEFLSNPVGTALTAG